MFQIFGCLLFLLFGVFIIVLSLGWSLLRGLFSIKKAAKDFTRGGSRNAQHEDSYQHKNAQSAGNKQNGEKIFKKNEGKYVDFEEIN